MKFIRYYLCLVVIFVLNKNTAKNSKFKVNLVDFPWAF